MKKVLIVDDDADVLALYGLLLRREGWGVVEAGSGPEALSKVVAETPDLVLLDVMMPEMNGYEVCRKLRREPQTAQLPILLISGKATISDRRNGMLAGANDFMNKTIGPRRLVARIRPFLDSAPSSQDIRLRPTPRV
jgi:DNA-binding response OmpR family regulator